VEAETRSFVPIYLVSISLDANNQVKREHEDWGKSMDH